VRLRRARPLLISLALHGALALVLVRLHGKPADRAPEPIEIDVRATEPAPRVSPIASPKTGNAYPLPHAPARADRRETANTSNLERKRNGAPDLDRSGADAERGGDRATEQHPPSSGRAIDLFATGALERAVPLAPSAGGGWGGTTRRAGDGRGDPNARDPNADREEAAARVTGWLADSAAENRARSGSVAPRWREAERRVTEGFHPPLDLVKQDDVGKTYAKQVFESWRDGPPKGGDLPRGIDPSAPLPGVSPGANLGGLALDQAVASQQATGRPQGWLRTEVEVVIDEAGRVVSAKVLHPSGRRRYDRAAVDAVTKAIGAGGAPEDKRAVVTRWSVEATLAVAPPTSLGFGFDESGALHPGASGARKYVDGVYPMKQEVKTRVALLSVRPL